MTKVFNSYFLLIVKIYLGKINRQFGWDRRKELRKGD